MATDATGTPTSPDSIPKYNTAVDAPSGNGFNAAMDQVQVALSARVSKPTGIISGEVPVWNGTTWVRSSVTGISPSSIAASTKKRIMVPMVFSTSGTAVADVQAMMQYQLSATLTTQIGFSIIYPDNYISGDFTVKFLLRSTATDANTAALRKSSFRFRDSTAFATIDNAVNVNITNWTANNDVTLTATILASNYQAGDTMRVDIQRLGADATDTHTGIISVDACWVEYTGN